MAYLKEKENMKTLMLKTYKNWMEFFDVCITKCKN